MERMSGFISKGDNVLDIGGHMGSLAIAFARSPARKYTRTHARAHARTHVHTHTHTHTAQRAPALPRSHATCPLCPRAAVT
jgi:hypothetical protein